LFTVNAGAGVKLLTVTPLQWAAEVKNNLSCTGIDIPIVCLSASIPMLYVLEVLPLL
jgi:hypothetical protein